MKICKVCNKEKELSYFISMVNGLETTTCSKCRGYNRKHIPKRVKFYNELKELLPPCEICGDNNIQHKHFDHVDKTTKKDHVNHGSTVQKIKEEAEKCRCLCMKCHKKVTDQNEHYGQRTSNKQTEKSKRREKAREYVNGIKINLGGCKKEQCTDVFDPENLTFYEFDHNDFRTKDRSIAYLVKNAYAVKTIQKELDKCVLLCAYCHTEKTKEQLQEKKKYFNDLKQPVKPRKKQEIKLTLDDVKGIRDSYNAGTHTQKQLGVIYGVAKGHIQHIVNNERYVDENYQRVIPKQKHRKRLPEEQRNEIKTLWFDTKPKPFTLKQLCEKYNCSKTQIENIVYKKKKNGEQV